MKYEIKTQLQISEFFPDFDEWNISIVSTVSLKTEYRFFFLPLSLHDIELNIESGIIF